MATDRTLRAGEWDEAMVLWTGAFGDVGWIFESLNAGTTGRDLKHTLVTEDDGKIVAAVDVFMREMRDEHGKPVKVGGIGSVATHPGSRRQGHSGRLLEKSIELMGQEGCAWSLLFTGLYQHYGRYGWETSNWRKRLAKGPKPAPDQKTYAIEALGNKGPWPLSHMAQIYATFNALRPLSHVRTELYWDVPIKVRLERPERRTWIAKEGEEIVGYVVADQPYGQWNPLPEVIEMAFRPGAEKAVAPLLETSLKGINEASIRLPSDPVIDAILHELFEDVQWAEHWKPMVRPIGADWSIERIRSMTDLPNAHCWDLDSF